MKNNSVYKEAARVSAVIFILGAVEFILFTVFMNFRLDILIGVLYGCTFTSLNFFYLASCVKKAVEKEEKAAKAYMSMSYSTRLLLTATMVIIAVRVEIIYLWSAIIPLIFQRLSIYIVSFLNSRSRKGSENS